VVIVAIAHLKSKARSSGNRPKAPVPRSKGVGIAAKAEPDTQKQSGTRTPIRIAAALRVFLESKQEELIKVESLMVCARKGMELEPGPKGAYYPDVLGLAADVLRRRVVNLDELLLDGVVPRESARSNR
jgi:hypothetical protein